MNISNTQARSLHASRRELALHGALASVQRFERRFEPFFRPALNAVLREPSVAVLQWLINRNRKDEGLALAEEKVSPEEEEEALNSIIEYVSAYMLQHYKPGEFQRGGNTKTHGIVRGEVTIRDDIPVHMRRGVFATPSIYKAWIRFSGPGSDSPKDIDDVGFASCSIKMMGVPGPKLLDDESGTQDFTAVCTPTFVTPNIVANADLQAEILRGTPGLYFFRPGRSHLLDVAMQSRWK